MNADIFKGKWKQLRGDVKKWWGDLTDDDLDRIAGERDKLVGRIQERYAFDRQPAPTLLADMTAIAQRMS